MALAIFYGPGGGKTSSASTAQAAPRVTSCTWFGSGYVMLREACQDME